VLKEPGAQPRGFRAWRAAGGAVAGALAAALLAACGASEPQAQNLTVATGEVTPTAVPTGPTSGLAAETATGAEGSATPTTSRRNARTTPTTGRRNARTTPKPARTTVTTTVVGAHGSVPRDDLRAIVATEKSAAASAKSVHVVGTVISGGRRYGVDLTVGGDGEGVLSYDRGTIAVRRVGSDLYLSADDAFFAAHQHPELAATYHGAWMPIVPDDPAYATILPLTRVSTWARLLASAPAARARAGTAVGGVATIAVSGGTGARANVLHVAAAAPHLPLLTVSADRKDQIRFSAWNATTGSVQRPTSLRDEPDDAVVDVPSFPEETARAFSALWRG
jgi:hypothetical protein